MTNSRFVPNFQVNIDDRPLPVELRAALAGINYQTGLEGSDRVELTVVNDNLRWLDNPLFAMARSLTLSIGYAPDPLEQVFVGEIVARNASFPSGSIPSLSIVAQDRMQRLQQGTKERWFAIPIPSVGNLPLPALAIGGIVALENGLVPIFDPIGAAIAVLIGGLEIVSVILSPLTGQKLIRKQAGETDFNFLSRIALETGWEMLIDHGDSLAGYKLRFMSPMDQLSADVTLKYGQSLIDFTPRISDVGQVTSISGRVWWPEIKMEFTVTVSWDWDSQSLDLSIVPGFGLPAALDETPEDLLSAFEDAQTAAIEDPQNTKKAEAASEAKRDYLEAEKKLEEANKIKATLVDEPLTLATAPRTILGKLIPKLNNRLTGSGSTVGDPRIKPGTVLRLEGLGEEFGGLYRVTSATHTIDSGGYRTSFEVRKEIWFGSIPSYEQGAVPVSLQGQHFG